MLIPRLQLKDRLALQNPAKGLLIFQTDSVSGFYFFNGLKWSQIAETTATGISIINKTIAELRALSSTDAVGNRIFASVDMGKEGLWKVDTSDHTSADNLGTILKTTADNIRLKRIYDGEIDVRWFGAISDASTDNTSFIQAAVNYCQSNNLNLHFSEGIWITKKIFIAGNINITLAEGATIKLKSNAYTSGDNILSIFHVYGSNVSVIGGKFDFNRAGQDSAAFNHPSKTANVLSWNAIRVSGSPSVRTSNITISTKIINSVDMGINCTYTDNINIFNTTISNSGSGVALTQCNNSIIYNLELDNLNNNNWKIYPHAIDIVSCKNVRTTNINSIKQASYGNSANGGSLSAFGASGYTAVNDSNLIAQNVYLSVLDDNNQVQTIGFSWLSNTNSLLDNFSTKNFTAVSLESGGNTFCQFSNGVIDGNYRSNTVNTFITGISIYDNGFYEDFLSRSGNGTSNCTFRDIKIMKLKGYGIYATKFSHCNFSNIQSIANHTGAYINVLNADASFAGRELAQSQYNVFSNCTFNYNETDGVAMYAGKKFRFLDCKFIGNGQAKTYGTLRKGGSYDSIATQGFVTYISTTTGAKLDSTELINCVFADEQSDTTKVSINPSNPRVISVSKIDNFSIGQTIIILKGAGVSTDLKARIDHIDKDEITVNIAPTNFATIGGTGNITTTSTTIPTGKTLTGTSTSFSTQLNYRTWIKVGSEYRQIVKQSNNTNATLYEPFSSILSNSSFDIVETKIIAPASQDYGFRTGSTATDFTVTNPNYLNGNKINNTFNAGTNIAFFSNRDKGKSPTVVAGAGAGSSPTVSISSGSSDSWFVVNLTSGPSPAANSTIATVTYANGSFISLAAGGCFPANAATASLNGIWFGTTLGTLTINATTALSASTVYKWHCPVGGK